MQSVSIESWRLFFSLRENGSLSWDTCLWGSWLDPVGKGVVGDWVVVVVLGEAVDQAGT